MKSNTFTQFVNYLFLFLVINYQLIVNYIIHIDYTGYGLIALSLVVLMLNAQDFQNIQSSKPIRFWFIWCLFAFVNYYIHPHDVNPMGFETLYRKIFIPLIAMTVVAKEYENNYVIMLWVALISYLVYAIGAPCLDPGILLRYLGEDNELGNAYANTSCFALFFLSLLHRFGKLKTLPFITLSIIVIIALAISGTRKAFGAGMIMIIFWALSIFNLHKTRTWVFLIAFAVVVLLGYNMLMDNTFMGQRMELLEEQQNEYLPQDAPKILSLFGDRASHYYYGRKIFEEHPLFGVGTGQTRVGMSYIHSEYMVQLTDNGIIGFSLFFMLYWWIGTQLMRRLKEDKTITICVIGGFVGILFMELTAWSWEFPAYFIPLGTCVAYCKYMDSGELGTDYLES